MYGQLIGPIVLVVYISIAMIRCDVGCRRSCATIHVKSVGCCTFCSNYAVCDVLRTWQWAKLITPQMGSGGGVVGIIIVFVCGDHGVMHVVTQ